MKVMLQYVTVKISTIPLAIPWPVQTRDKDCRSSSKAQMQWPSPSTLACNNHKYNRSHATFQHISCNMS